VVTKAEPKVGETKRQNLAVLGVQEDGVIFLNKHPAWAVFDHPPGSALVTTLACDIWLFVILDCSWQ
jgi:hypothetical protein